MDKEYEAHVDNFLSEVKLEIIKATNKYPAPNPNVAALSGESGEACEAMVKKMFTHVYSEAVQAACVAARLAIEGDPTMDEYRMNKGLDKSGVIDYVV